METVTIKIKRTELDDVMELYQAFGYEFVSTAPTKNENKIYVSVKRNNKHVHNKKVVRLQRQFNFLLRKHPYNSYPWLLLGGLMMLFYFLYIKTPMIGFLLVGSIFCYSIGLFLVAIFFASLRKRSVILNKLVEDAKDLSGTYRVTPIYSNLTKAVTDTGNIRKYFSKKKK